MSARVRIMVDIEDLARLLAGDDIDECRADEYLTAIERARRANERPRS